MFRPVLLALVLTPLPALADPVTVTDTLGREVTLAGVPERVVATTTLQLFDLLALGVVPVGTEIPPAYMTMGDGPALAAMADLPGFDLPEGLAIPAVNNLDWIFDWEKVAALSPDLIFVGDADSAKVAETIAPAFATYASRADGTDDLEIVKAAFLGLGAAVGRGAEAEAFWQAQIDRTNAYAALAPGDRSVLLISTGGRDLWVMGTPSLTCQLWNRIGTCASPGGALDYWMEGSPELILAVDPDVLMILNDCTGDCTARHGALMAYLESLPLWSDLSAVQTGRVHFLPYDARAYSAASLGGLFDATLPLIYPETFPAPLTETQVAAALKQE